MYIYLKEIKNLFRIYDKEVKNFISLADFLFELE